MQNFTWMEECHQVFEELKKFLGSLPLLSKPVVREELYLYLAASLEVVSSILIWVDDKGTQRPIYILAKYFMIQISGTLKLKRLFMFTLFLHNILGLTFKSIQL